MKRTAMLMFVLSFLCRSLLLMGEEKIDLLTRLSLGQQKVDFYGLVLDQNKKPVKGVEVIYKTSAYGLLAPSYTRGKTETDADGRFEIHEGRAAILYLKDFIACGYEYSLFANTKRSFDYDISYRDRHRPDQANPVVFHLRKKQAAGTYLVKKEFKITLKAKSEEKRWAYDLDAGWDYLPRRDKNPEVFWDFEGIWKLDLEKKKILEINSITKSFGDRTLIKDFSYNFKKGDKIAIIGHNGCGKTTLLNILMGKEKADSGNIISGQTIEFGYYQQQGLEETEDKRVIDVIRDVAENIQINSDGKTASVSATEFLSRFGFPKNMQFAYYSLLSGGEKRRLYLLKTLIQNPNFLILDEPTNDLDIYSLLTLEEFLRNYKGCLLIVSHDKRFIENISENHSFIFTGEGKIKDCYIPYDEYLAQQRKQERSEKNSVESEGAKSYKEQKAQNKPKNKLSFKEKKLKEELESQIPVLEQRKQELTEQLSSGTLSTEDIMKAGEEIEKIMQELEEKEMLWLELSEKEE